mmetsp:Transcript_58860/g.127770  ORF Transcript_58860/g.127770 Transcript_58860/m.127770 type:complete len:252 (-) Transcript_58860:13-768(-)
MRHKYLEVLNLNISLVTVFGLVGSPEGQVISQQLHDKSAVLVALLGQSVQFGDGVIKSLFGELTSTIGGVQDLVVEHRKVQGKTQSDGVGGGKVSSCDGRSVVVSLKSLGGGFLADITRLELSEVSVVVTLHLVVEDLSFLGVRVGDKLVLDNLKNIRADIYKLVFDLRLVVTDEAEALDLSFLLDGGDYSPRRTAGADNVLVGNGKKVSLLDGKLLRLLGNSLHVINHLIESFSLLGQLGHVHKRISVHL